ncbi:MAG: hypothetical protein IPJ40_24355 [Saprospirales bacterium]|nr:hypothetical protein [Saprospirales bacterium]
MNTTYLIICSDTPLKKHLAAAFPGGAIISNPDSWEAWRAPKKTFTGIIIQAELHWYPGDYDQMPSNFHGIELAKRLRSNSNAPNLSSSFRSPRWKPY